MPDLNKSLKKTCIVTAALAGLAVSGSSFAIEPLKQGYMLASANVTGEGKCGAGTYEAKADNQKKTAEGKCGEGQCGDAIFNKIDTDHDSRISRAEFLTVSPNGEAVFEKKDTNHDGYIDEMESYLSVKAAYNEHGKDLPKGLFSIDK
ncbi:EF-hand domain-containing protein [Pseudomonas sp. NPDC089422]|uniref:HvfA family oxazolone/thioamide-modified RiPP metallophore n=1 Tax=Pseudomonas sp. NPDC089422 TaxID=3364466 RepID=UPI003802C6C3